MEVPAADGESSKRKAVRQACDACRRRKMKCDGSVNCQPCQKSDIPCTYEFVQSKRGRPGNIMESLREAKKQRTAVAANASPSTQMQPTATTDAIAPREVIAFIVDLYFERAGVVCPLLHPASFKADVRDKRDTTDPRFFHLLLNVCTAGAIACHGEELPPNLSEHFSSFEDAARSFNNCLPTDKRLRTMFADRNVEVLHNIMLVSIFERHLGTPVAYHLTYEGVRFVAAYGWYAQRRDHATLEYKKQQRVLWMLYIWDKIYSLASNQPMSMRADEIEVPPPDPTDDFDEHGVFVSLLARLAMLAEDSILNWRRDARLQSGPNDTLGVKDSFRSLVARIVAVQVKWPGPDMNKIQETVLALFQQTLCLEMYRRYGALLNRPELDVSHISSSVNIAGRILDLVTALPPSTVDLLGPECLDMVIRAHVFLRTTIPFLRDPFAQHSAAQQIHRAHELFKHVDMLRKTSLIESADCSAPGIPSPLQDAVPTPPALRTAHHLADGHSSMSPAASLGQSPSDLERMLMGWTSAQGPPFGLPAQQPPASAHSLVWLNNLPLLDILPE